jgi:hypothetical protein
MGENRMEEGERYREKYSDQVVIVEEVHDTHMFVTVETSGLYWMIHENSYKYLTKIEE